ncbi:MAG: FMN-binding negative transcriptional regulator [Gemmatimonadota bacterium]
MIDYPYYRAPTREAEEDFFRSQSMGRLITRSSSGEMLAGLYPYVLHENQIELHLVRGDVQAKSLRGQPSCLFEVDQVLSYIPSHWQDPENAQKADNFYRFACVRGSATVSDDISNLAAHLGRLIQRNQPEGRHRRLEPDEPMFAAGYGRLAVVWISMNQVDTKFKLGQNYSIETRRSIIAHLRERNASLDHATADEVELWITHYPDISGPVPHR